MEHESLAVPLAGILVIGTAAQWIAWRLRLPAILLLLLAGFAAGPITGWIDPDALMGKGLVLPIVSLSVAVILFEGGMSLKFSELRRGGGTVGRLLLLGVPITWGITTIAARTLLGLPFSIAVLLGAILVVTGPTVIGPILRHLRPTGPVGPILKWEGILIDPIGATLAVLVFEGVLAGGFQEATGGALAIAGKTLGLGVGIGFAGAGLLLLLLYRFWMPDYLHSPVTLATVLAAFCASNHVQPESGLLTVTVMGMILANQRWVPIREILVFKENLRVLLITSLFILLAARLDPADLRQLPVTGTIGFLIVLVLLARPASVLLSTLGSKLSGRDRLFLAAMAPRGIVAAAVSSVFAFRLEQRGIPGAELLVPATFAVIVVTVALYGLSAGPLARHLRLAERNPQGMLIVGAHEAARAIALPLHEAGVAVVLVDTNTANLALARAEGLRTLHGNILSEETIEGIEIGGLGRVLAMTPNDEVNSLAVLHFAEVFGRSETYQLPPSSPDGEATVPTHMRGRLLFGEKATVASLARRVAAGEKVTVVRIPEGEEGAVLLERIEEGHLPLARITSDGTVDLYTTRRRPEPVPGDTLLVLGNPREIPTPAPEDDSEA